MTDNRLRTAARQAALDGSPEARAAWLRERLRAGTIDPERVALAAWAGDAPSRLLLDHDKHCHACGASDPDHGNSCGDCPSEDACGNCGYCGLCQSDEDTFTHESEPKVTRDLSAWLRGLSRWGPEVQRLASLAASTEAHGEAHKGGTEGMLCKAFSCKYRLLLDAAALVVAGVNRGAEITWDEVWSRNQGRCAWLPAPIGTPERRLSEILAASQVAGEQPVRAAICSALIAWALS